MKATTKYLTFNIPTRMDFVNITHDVEAVVRESGIREGLCLVNAMHITASVFINDNESGLHADYKDWLEHLAPHAMNYVAAVGYDRVLKVVDSAAVQVEPAVLSYLMEDRDRPFFLSVGLKETHIPFPDPG